VEHAVNDGQLRLLVSEAAKSPIQFLAARPLLPRWIERLAVHRHDLPPSAHKTDLTHSS
jgi:hypothetical protein